MSKAAEDTAKQRELAAKMEGVTALNSYDEVVSALEKLLK